MKTKTAMMSIMVLWMILGVYGAALADGGVEPPKISCASLPQATLDSPLIHGTFTATPWALEGQPPKKYDIHMVLKMWQLKDGKDREIIRLYSFQKDIVDLIPLCTYTELDLINKYLVSACNRDIQKLFNIAGVGVLTELKILKMDNCDDPEIDNDMVHGTFKVRIVNPGT